MGTTRGIYVRWGAPSLIFAKFIPGVAAVATTLAGQTGTRFGRFAFYDGLGATLWAGVAIALGMIFHDAVQEVLLRLESLGRIGMLSLLLVAAWGQPRPGDAGASCAASACRASRHGNSRN